MEAVAGICEVSQGKFAFLFHVLPKVKVAS